MGLSGPSTPSCPDSPATCPAFRPPQLTGEAPLPDLLPAFLLHSLCSALLLLPSESRSHPHPSCIHSALCIPSVASIRVYGNFLFKSWQCTPMLSPRLQCFAGGGQKVVLSPPVWREWPLMGEQVKEGEIMQLAQDPPGGGGKVGDTPSQPHPLDAPVCPLPH